MIYGFNNPHGLFKMAPGNGVVVEYKLHRGAKKPTPVWGPTPVKTGERYVDSGYPGSVRRRMERESGRG